MKNGGHLTSLDCPFKPLYKNILVHKTLVQMKNERKKKCRETALSNWGEQPYKNCKNTFLLHCKYLCIWHRSVWLMVSMTPWSILHIHISPRNWNYSQKYFSISVRGPDGLDSQKKQGLKFRGHCPFKCYKSLAKKWKT